MKRNAFFAVLFLIATNASAQEYVTIQNPATPSLNVASVSPSKNGSSSIKIKKDESTLNGNESSISKGSSRLIATLSAKGFSTGEILNIRRKMESVQKALSEEKIPVSVNRTVKFIKGMELDVKVKTGYATILNFVDGAGNPVRFTYLTVGNNFVKVVQFGNKLEIKPLRKYCATNLIVGIEGYDYPVTVNVQEAGDSDSFDNYVNVVMAGMLPSKVGSEDIAMKSAILDTVFKYGNVSNLPRIDYEVYSLKTKKNVLFSKKLLKIYRVDKFGKTYYLVLLDKNFEMYGNKPFGTYDSRFYVYFLNFNQNVFTIRTSPSLKMPYPMVERYRIVIKDF